MRLELGEEVDEDKEHHVGQTGRRRRVTQQPYPNPTQAARAAGMKSIGVLWGAGEDAAL